VELFGNFRCHQIERCAFSLLAENILQTRELRRILELLFSLSVGSLAAVLVLRLTERAHPHSALGHISDWLQHDLRLGREYSTWFTVFFVVLSVLVLLILQLIAQASWSVKALRLIPGFFAVGGPFICWYPWGRTHFILVGMLLVLTVATLFGIYLYLRERWPFGSMTSFWLLFWYFLSWGYVITVQIRNETLLVIPSIGFFSCLVWGQYIRSSGTNRVPGVR
jgi:hypothetical protein